MNRVLCAIALLTALAAGSAAAMPPPLPEAKVVTCFTLTTGMDCGQLITRYIDLAKKSVDVQAYNFTANDIISAIVRAKKRGLAVRVILDKISPTQQCEGADRLLKAGIPVWIDYKPKIAHNKVIIIDGEGVFTGSFNFSTNAEQNNAENTNYLISDQVAQLYAANFESRLMESRPWDGKHTKPVKACPVNVDE